EIVREQQRGEIDDASLEQLHASRDEGFGRLPALAKWWVGYAQVAARQIRRSLLREKIPHRILTNITIDDVGGVDMRADGLERLRHAPVLATRHLPDSQPAEFNMLGKRIDHPRGSGIVVARNSRIAGFVLTHFRLAPIYDDRADHKLLGT